MSAHIVPSGFDHRYDLADLCNEHGVTNAAEIGTDRGEFAVHFLQRWKGQTLLCVDSYVSYDNMPWPRHMDAMVAAMRLAPFGDRVRFIPMESVRAAHHLHKEWRLQFIYIDGDHEYSAVRQDLEAWWPRLDPRGILAGHDFANHQGGWFDIADLSQGNGVVKAVMEFAGDHELIVNLTVDIPRSWYLFKPR
jgi:predicted O-methyltransferase YrrM